MRVWVWLIHCTPDSHGQSPESSQAYVVRPYFEFCWKTVEIVLFKVNTAVVCSSRGLQFNFFTVHSAKMAMYHIFDVMSITSSILL